MTLKPLDKLKDFVILDELGHGGMGAAYIGYEPSRRRLVVIKTLFEQFTNDEIFVKRFQREADVYKKLDHPNIVRYIDSGLEDGTHFIAMEYIHSRPLDSVLKDATKLPIDMSVKILGHLADAVSHAHEKKIIHRDLKPQNVMFSEDGVVKLLDFGIAHQEDELLKTTEGTVMGTFHYAAPEQNQGRGVTERSDLYSLGAILYELITGQRPFKGSNLLEVTSAQVKDDITHPSVLIPELPKGLEKLILKLMQKDPGRRYQSAKELIMDLQKFKEDPKGFDPGRMFDNEELAGKWEKAKDALLKRNFDFALELAKAVLEAKPDSAEIHIHVAKCYVGKGLKAPAIMAFKKAIGLEPTNAQYQLDYGIGLYNVRAYDDADKQIALVLENDPGNPYATRYVTMIKDAKQRVAQGLPPPGPAPTRPSQALSPEAAAAATAPTRPSKSLSTDPGTATGGVGAGADQAARAQRLSRVWWGAGALVAGQKSRFLVLSVLEIAVLALIGAGAAGPALPLPKAIHVTIRTIIVGPTHWVLAGIAGLIFLLFEIRIPKKLFEELSGGASR